MEDTDQSVINCIVCFKHIDLQSIKSRGIKKAAIVYQSCCKFVDKENLGEDFFKWSHQSPLPFCEECLTWAQKLALLNAKLEAVHGKVAKCVKKFTVYFLREREANLIIEANHVPFESNENEDFLTDSNDPVFQDLKVLTSENLLKNDDYNSLEDLEENTVVKMELENNIDHVDDSDGHFHSYTSNESECIETKPNIDGLNVEKIDKHKNRKTATKKEKRKIIDETEYSGASSMTFRSLPRRMAAERAIKSFSSNKERSDEETEEDDGSSVSEDFSMTDSGSEVDEKGRIPGKSRSKKKRTPVDTNPNTRCKYCKLDLKTAEELENHLPIHDAERPFSCEKCSLRFVTQASLTAHVKKHYNERFFVCGHCKNSYKYLYSLKGHIKTQKYHKKFSDPCEICESAIGEGNKLLSQHKIEKESLHRSPDGKVLKKSKLKNRKSENENKPYGCDQCDQSFGTIKGLAKHAWTHFTEKYFKCGHCENSYKYSHCLKDHIKNQKHHEDSSDLCEICDNAIAEGRKLLNQYKIDRGFPSAPTPDETTQEKNICTKSEERPFGCDKCNLYFKSEKLLRVHKWKHFSEKFFKCAHCDNTYKYMHCLKDHVRNQGHHSAADIVNDSSCILCEEAIKVGKELVLQKKIENGYSPSQSGNGCNILKEIRKKYKIKKEPKEVVKKERIKIIHTCPECGKTLPGKSELFYHRYLHQPPGTELKCEMCTEIFTDSVSHQKHTVEAHPKVSEPSKNSLVTQCPVCGKLLRGNISRHMYLHSDVKQFACPTCDKRFLSKRSMKVHSVIHSKDRPFLCEECGQGFYTSSKLKEHYRIHTGLLLFCEFCPKGFRNSTHLKQHVRSHNKESRKSTDKKQKPEILQTLQSLPFQCSYCGQYFESESLLTIHMIVHTQNNY